MSDSPLQITREDGIVTVALDRPRVHNAFDEHTIAALSATFASLADDADARVIVLRGNGRSFSAGGDANWMKRMAAADARANRDDALALAQMLRRLTGLPQPVVARVHGYAYGGAVGLASACDIVLAADDARFALSEVRLGLVPAVISPFVVEAIGARQAHRYFLTGESFDAATAQRIGLVHEVVPAPVLDARLEQILRELAQAGPAAQREAKTLINTLVSGDHADAGETDAYTADLIARVRDSAEGREGIGAFLDKRTPAWRS
ncbi:MAG: enoyl-CoA hydratase-related protein [Pseudomonadota bacterium]